MITEGLQVNKQASSSSVRHKLSDNVFAVYSRMTSQHSDKPKKSKETKDKKKQAMILWEGTLDHFYKVRTNELMGRQVKYFKYQKNIYPTTDN